MFRDHPDLLQLGDPLWFGSVIDPEIDLVTAASGGPEEVDHLLAQPVFDLIRTPTILAVREAIQTRGTRHTTL